MQPDPLTQTNQPRTGPLPGTLEDYWRMIVENKLKTIVMVTKCVEGRVRELVILQLAIKLLDNIINLFMFYKLNCMHAHIEQV